MHIRGTFNTSNMLAYMGNSNTSNIIAYRETFNTSNMVGTLILGNMIANMGKTNFEQHDCIYGKK